MLIFNTDKHYSDVVNNYDTIHKCPYLTPDQFSSDPEVTAGNFNLLNINIRSLSKNVNGFQECLKQLDHEFDNIGISETHLKGKPHSYYSLTRIHHRKH